jgi:DNA repair/transcription protein MET18/MMS19
LHALTAIAENYGSKAISLYSVTLWDAVKFEILQAQDMDLAEQSLELLSAIGITLSKDNGDGLLNFLKPIIKECNEHLEDAPTKQSEAASQMLYTVCSSTWLACNVVLSGVLPQLFTLYSSTRDMPKRRSLIHTFAKLTEASSLVFGNWGKNPRYQEENSEKDTSRFGTASRNSLLDFKEQAVDLVTSGLTVASIKDVSLRLALLEASKQLIGVREALTDADISKIISILNSILLKEEVYGKDEARSSAINVLDAIAKQRPQLIIEQCFPAFMGQLPDTDVGHNGKYVPILEAFAKIGVEDKILGTVVLRLRNKLVNAIRYDATAEYIQAILSALLYSISNSTSSLLGKDDFCPYYSDLIVPLSKDISASLKPHQKQDVVFGLIGRICNEILRQQTSAFQSSLPGIFNLATESSPTWTPNPDVAQSDGQYLIISAFILASLRRDVVLSYDKKLLLDLFLNLARNQQLTPGTKAAVSQLLSLLLNKFFTNAELKQNLQPSLDELLSKFSSIPTLFAILKALVLRNSPILNTTLPLLVTSLSSTINGPSIAHGFSLLLEPDPVLSKENHCNISPLHKQKTFATVIPPIADSVRTAETGAKKNFLVALAGILRWLPFSVLEPEITSLCPLLLQTLDIEGEPDIKVGALDQLTAILESKSEVLEPHASSLITRLLNLSSASTSTTKFQHPPRIRAKALQCLAFVPTKLKREIAIPYRTQVSKKLTGALDDGRRAVRSEAVKCRRVWIELDGGSDDNDEDDK